MGQQKTTNSQQKLKSTLISNILREETKIKAMFTKKNVS